MADHITDEAVTAAPELIMGTRPDDSPWVISAEFAGPAVRVDAYGVLRLHNKAIAPAAAHRIATGLLAAITWLESDGAAKAEPTPAPRVPRVWQEGDPDPAEEGLVIRDADGDEAAYRNGHWDWTVIDGEQVEHRPWSWPAGDMAYPATEVLPEVVTPEGPAWRT